MHVVVSRLHTTRPLAPDEIQQIDRELPLLVGDAPGFRAFYWARAGETETLTVSVWDRAEDADAALERVRPWLAQTVGAILAGAPERQVAEVLVARQRDEAVTAAAEANKALMLRVLEEVFRKGNLDFVDEAFAPDFVNHHSGSGRTREDLKRFAAGLRTAIPDLEYEVVNLVAGGDRVAVHVRGRGTHQGELFGMPPTGKPFETETMTIVRIADGRVAERWYIPDTAGLMQQVGALAMEGQGRA